MTTAAITPKVRDTPKEAKNAIREQLDLNLNQDALAAVMLLSSVLHYTKESNPVLCSCLFEHPVINGKYWELCERFLIS